MSKPPGRFLDRTSPPHIATLILIAGLSALSMNIFLPSLPNMAVYFGVEYGVMQLSVSLYLGVSAVLQILIGPLSDRYGRRNVLLVAMGLFVLASVGTLLAPNAEVFLVFRMGQAVIATAMALSRAVVRDMVDEAQAASMLGYVTMGMSIVPMLGPVVGGVVDEIFGWQGNFALLLLAGILVMALTWADLGETAGTRPTSLMAQMRDYPELFASPRFWGYVMSSSFASGVFFAFLGGAPFVGTEIYGLSPTALGGLFAFTALGYAAGNFLSGRFSMRMGVNRMILVGAFITLAGLVLQAAVLAAGVATAFVFFGCFLFVGIGNGMVLPNATAGMLSVRPHLAGTASGLGGAIMIGGGAALSALAGMLLVPGSGAWPLVLIMLASALASLLSVFAVIRRERNSRG
ncbi:multidrug effflux MFS transporter [Pararhodobacter sp.]|uniref:multidrug effflux MFS transporter n=1 Tax=Pararhodobacter sp. TaxID=2127056 RepID=UPI002FDE2F1B